MISKYAPLATSNASQFVDILLRGLAGDALAGPDFSGLPALRDATKVRIIASSEESVGVSLTIRDRVRPNCGGYSGFLASN